MVFQHFYIATANVKRVDLLGFVVYEKLTCKTYVKLVEKKILKRIESLLKASGFLNSEFLLSIYFVLVHLLSISCISCLRKIKASS